MSDLLKKREPEVFILNEKQQNAFKVLRDALICPQKLTLPVAPRKRGVVKSPKWAKRRVETV
jgi:hypothetical protein